MLFRNIILIPATGRNLYGIPSEVLKEGIRYAIVSNGAEVVDVIENKVIWKRKLSNRDLQLLVSKFKRRYFLFTLHTDCSCFDSTLFQMLVRKLVFKKSSIFFPKFKNIINFEEIDKIQLMFLSKKKLKTIYSMVKSIETIHVVKSSKHSIEITNINATKGNALKFISEYLNIDRADIASIGDNDNDIEMLEYSGISYAVQNASEKARKVANYIVSNNDEDALKDIILNDELLKLDYSLKSRV